MHTEVLAVSFLFATIVTPAASQSLQDALKSAGASKFAALIQSNANAFNLYQSGTVKTIFAPADSAVLPAPLQARSGAPPPNEAQLLYQATTNEVSMGQASQDLPGSLLPMALPAPGLDTSPQQNHGQVVATDTRPANLTHPSKRAWDGPFIPRRQQAGGAESAPPSLLRISAGLGNVSNVIKGDIPFSGGLIHLTDSYFTLPQSVSDTAQATGQTAFARLANSSNLTSTLDNTPAVTVFLPRNEALSAATGSAQLVNYHLVTGFVGYLPSLTDGLRLTTRTGAVLTVSIRGGIWYVNDARITQANLILQNGVAHVIDKVLSPAPSPPPVTGAGTSVVALGNKLPSLVALVLMTLL